MNQQAVAVFRRARKASTSFLRVEVSDSWVLLGRGAAQIGDGITRKGAMRAGRGKRLVLRRGAESLGPSRIGDVAAAPGGDRWRINVANVKHLVSGNMSRRRSGWSSPSGRRPT